MDLFFTFTGKIISNYPTEVHTPKLTLVNLQQKDCNDNERNQMPTIWTSAGYILNYTPVFMTNGKP